MKTFCSPIVQCFWGSAVLYRLGARTIFYRHNRCQSEQAKGGPTASNNASRGQPSAPAPTDSCTPSSVKPSSDPFQSYIDLEDPPKIRSLASFISTACLPPKERSKTSGDTCEIPQDTRICLQQPSDLDVKSSSVQTPEEISIREIQIIAEGSYTAKESHEYLEEARKIVAKSKHELQQRRGTGGFKCYKQTKCCHCLGMECNLVYCSHEHCDECSKVGTSYG